jgi:hypothetical protein
MTLADITERVNAAMNFFADTQGVDYMEGFSEREVRAYDREVKEDLWVFPELRQFGY